jgi:hypothetical protein
VNVIQKKIECHVGGSYFLRSSTNTVPSEAEAPTCKVIAFSISFAV